MTARELVFKPTVKIDAEMRKEFGLNNEDVQRFVPKFISSPTVFYCSKARELATRAVLVAMRAGIRIMLNPRSGKVGDLGPDEVDEVYDREARSYDGKHHITTRGQDLIWRRHAASCVVNYIVQNGMSGKVLDMCTGTGLTTKEIDKAIGAWSLEAKVVSLDYNQTMLRVARQNLANAKNIDIAIVRGDATDLLEKKPGFTNFSQEEFDVVTQMFGIGGIGNPLAVASEVLKVLKENGQYFLADMHAPLQNFFGEWPLFFKWLQMPLFEALCYEIITIPLALERLWGWRDTTALFYLFRLITIQDQESGKYFGYRVISAEFTPDRWWFSLPIMPVAKSIFEKVEISEEEALKRQQILSVCKS